MTVADYKLLIGEIIKAAKEVHDTLGDGFLEQVYEEAVFHELAMRGLRSERQFNIDVIYKGIVLEKKYIPDLYVEETVLVEIKSIKDLAMIDESQLMNYLKVANVPAGLLINFGPQLAVQKRVLKDITGEPTTGTQTDPELLAERNNPEMM